MNLRKEIETSRKNYSNDWEKTSLSYFEKGLYDFLIEDYNQNIKILEIGCGSGYSSITLNKKADIIRIVDENIYCIESAYSKLNALGIKTSKILRGETIVYDKELSYEMNYKKIESKFKEKVACIEGDILTDFQLLDFLKNDVKFDVITCWFIGAHALKLSEENQRKKGRSAINRNPLMVQEYKWDVVEKIAENSHSLLKEHGIIHLAERVLPNYPDEAMVNLYNERLDKYGLKNSHKMKSIEVLNNNDMTLVNLNGQVGNQFIKILDLKYSLC